MIYDSISQSVRGTLIECFFSHTCRHFSAWFDTRVHANSCRFTSAFISIFLSIVAHVRCNISIYKCTYIYYMRCPRIIEWVDQWYKQGRKCKRDTESWQGNAPDFPNNACFIRSDLKASITLSMLYRFDESMPRQRHADNNLCGVGRLFDFIRMHTQPSESIATRKLLRSIAFTYFRFQYPFTQEGALGAPPVIPRPSVYYIYHEYMNIICI